MTTNLITCHQVDDNGNRLSYTQDKKTGEISSSENSVKPFFTKDVKLILGIGAIVIIISLIIGMSINTVPLKDTITRMGNLRKVGGRLNRR
tara:strand:+ start:260 stop:532 length:273 start_codon:yes stop_codon:yes gene_type:complete